MKTAVKVLVIFSVVLGFYGFVSLPALYAGAEMAITSHEINEYNHKEVKTDSDTDYVSNSFAVREELANSNNPVIFIMANSVWFVWIPMFGLLGLYPIIVLIDNPWTPLRATRKILGW